MQRRQTLSFFLFLCSLLSSFPPTTTTRPKLKTSEYWIGPSTIFNTKFESFVVRLGFDDDLFVNADSFLCGKAEEGCVFPPCVPCDWSGQNPEGCDNPDCCGPSQVGGEVEDRVQEWCANTNTTTTTTTTTTISTSTMGYSSLKLNEPSSPTSLRQGEKTFFRFFLGEEEYCRAVKIIVKPYYGVPIVRVSNLYAFPDAENSEWVRGSSPASIGLAQNYITLCPNSHTNYRLGTYAINIQADFDTLFTVEVVVSPQAHPLPPPPLRLPCSNIPKNEFISEKNNNICLEDGITLSQSLPRNKYSELLLPLPFGCSTISLSATLNNTLEEVNIYCLPRNPDLLTTRENALVGRAVASENRLSFSLCLEESLYIHCSAFSKSDDVVDLIFSTVSLPYRIPLKTETATSFTYQDTITAASPVFFGVAQEPCLDFLSENCYNWLSAPSSDPLLFFPPPPQLPLFNAPVDLYGEYIQSGLSEEESKSLYMVIINSVDGVEPYPLDLFKKQGSIAILSITNRDGEVVDLPGGGFDSSKKIISKYIPHIPASDLKKITILDFCDYDNYLTFQTLVGSFIDTIEEESTVKQVETVTYAFDAYNSAFAGKSCLISAIDDVDNNLQNVTRIEQKFCRFDRFEEPIQWEQDPCCNDELSPVTCCFPFQDEVEVVFYDTPSENDLQGVCGVPECAVSYYEELTNALNQLNDPIQGCSSGIKDPDEVLAVSINRDFERVIRACLTKIGYGDEFSGTTCTSDADCQNKIIDEKDNKNTKICNRRTKKCTLPMTAELEKMYLQCYIEKMPSYLENFIREEILPFGIKNYPKESKAFFTAIQEAASLMDCVNPNNPLEINKRERFVWDTELIECKAEQLGVSKEDFETINALCPPQNCLGTSCRANYDNCFANCNTEYRFTPVQTCPPEPICTVSDLSDCSGSYCVYSPNNHTFPNVLIPGVGREECEEGIGCELKDGRMLFGLTEQECRDYDASCTTNCLGEGCLSLSGTPGICVSHSTIFPDLSTKDSCAEVQNNTWVRCEDFSVEECGKANDFVQKSLGCYKSPWRECKNQEECENSGSCSDLEYTTIIQSTPEEYPISLQIGACFNSGFNDDSDLPTCFGDMDRPGIGCRELFVTNASECEGTLAGLYPFREWVTPAFTENECQNDDVTRFGCLLSGPEQQLLWLNEEECICRGGTSQFAWKWEKGTWEGGIPRSLSWKKADKIPRYELQSRLSFLILESWLETAVEQQFLYRLRSEVICKNNFIEYSLTSLVCDCFSEEKNSDCYNNNNNRENLVGISAVCTGESSAVKGPSGRVTFSDKSISEGCSTLNLSIVNQAWFAGTTPDVSISFRFQNHNTPGNVRNSKGATVGVLMGDGTVISFQKTEKLKSFFVCLRVSIEEEEEEEEKEEGLVRDFGVSSSAYSVIHPLGLENIEIFFESQTEFWCKKVKYEEITYDNDGIIRLFPIYRNKNFKNQEEGYVSEQTKILMYILGCFYAVDFILFMVYFIYKPPGQKKGSRRRQIAFPLSILFSILCVFRICFMFMYPNGVFYEEELSEFVVFEIPTFLLFTIVIISIGFWKNLSNRTGFFTKDSNILVYIGVVLVWCLWVVVTVVYAEVILETDAGESPCVGRVPPSNSEIEDNARTLTIVYQSIIISVTFLLAAIFLYFTNKLLSAAKNLSRVKKFILFIGGLITFTFLARCILFIIFLAVDFTSSVYMFCTLFLTEVLMMFLCGLQFNQLFFNTLGGKSGSTTRTSTVGSISPRSSHQSN